MITLDQACQSDDELAAGFISRMIAEEPQVGQR